MRPLIIATDFSNASENAANYGADMAVALKKDIILLHVMEVPASPFQMATTEFEFNEIEKLAKENMAALQERLRRRVSNKVNIAGEIQYGTVEYEIGKMAFGTNPFAIVLGFKVNHTRRFFLGSTALRLIHQTPFPVLMIPENSAYRRIERISIASDLSGKETEMQMLFIRDWLNAYRVSPDIIYINNDGIPGTQMDAGLSGLKNELAEFSPRFRFRNMKSVVDGIDNLIAENKGDLLMVLPEKHGFLESIFQKSESNQIILHSHLPVLSVFAGKSAARIRKESSEPADGHSCGSCNGDCVTKKSADKIL